MTASTAFFTGVKANYEVLGFSAGAPRSKCDPEAHKKHQADSVLAWAQKAGKDTGFVVTIKVTDATPAALYSHINNRTWECDGAIPPQERGKGCKDIALQLIEDEPGKNIKVILGGGTGFFRTESPQLQNCRLDGRDLIEEWLGDKDKCNATAQFVTNTLQLRQIDTKNTDFLLGLFAQKSMDYELDRDTNPLGQPSLKEMTKVALKILRKNTKEGYFLMVEGSNIDIAHHANSAKKALHDTLMFDATIKQTLEMVNLEDTLVIVNADHSHVFTMGGYPDWDENIFGFADTDDRGLPYTILTYANGPGFWQNFLNVTSVENGAQAWQTKNLALLSNEQLEDKNFVQIGTAPNDSEAHGGEDVGIYAGGPMSHLFNGVFENTHPAYVMAYAACIGPFSYDNCDRVSRTSRTSSYK